MKHGRSNNFDSALVWWVLPDKPMTELQTSNTFTGGWQDVDGWKAAENKERYRDILERSCKGKWIESNQRYFFELEEDYEMFLMMCSLIT